MALYAHAVIEVGDRKYARGATVPEDTPGLEVLMESGAVSEEKHDAAADAPLPPPGVVEIDGVRYVRSADAADSDTAEALSLRSLPTESDDA